MIDEIIARIEARLHSSEAFSEENRAELLNLLATLKIELQALAKADPDQARAIAAHIEHTAHEAVSRAGEQSPSPPIQLSSLASSLYGLEVRHPRLAELVSNISLLLSNTGI